MSGLFVSFRDVEIASQGLRYTLLNERNSYSLWTRSLLTVLYFSRLLTDESRRIGLPASLCLLLLSVRSRGVLLPLATVVSTVFLIIK